MTDFTDNSERERLDRERARQRSLMAHKRAAGRDLVIPPVFNPRRRRRCGKDPALFLRTYFPTIFYNPFTQNQRQIIEAFVRRLEDGGWSAVAAARGDGKTSLARGLSNWAIVNRRRRFLVLIGANQRESDANLSSIRHEFEANDALAEDFPEICVPIRALAGANQRAGAQTVGGARTYIHWTGSMIVLPTVAGSPASGAVIVACSIEGSIKGLNHQGIRPDFAYIDDLETTETVKSEADTAARESKIEQEVLGLAGPDKRLAILFTCSLYSLHSVAARYTDRKIKPAWAGTRHRMLLEKPKREDLWAQYMDLRTTGQLQGDENGRAAHRFYADHRRQMDAGAVLANPYRFDGSPLPDGTPTQLSALQFVYDFIADTGGWNTFNCQYQNDPPQEESAEALSVDFRGVMKRTNGLTRGTFPAGSDFLTAGLDLGARVLHWTVLAWLGGRGYVVDYGAIPVRSPVVGNVEDPANVPGVQRAILDALLEFRDMAAAGWADAGTGEARALDLALVDAGYARGAFDLPVYEFCRQSPGYQPSKGYGTGSGQASYRALAAPGPGRRLGHHWHATWQPHPKRAWLHHLDADYWKKAVHDGFLTPPERPGALTVFGDDPVAHRLYANHIAAEEWTGRHVPGKGMVWAWVEKSHHNHWFDTTYMATAASGVLGVRNLPSELPPPAPAGGAAAKAPAAAPAPPKLSDLYRQRRQH